jgi:hypothetical protein
MQALSLLLLGLVSAWCVAGERAASNKQLVYLVRADDRVACEGETTPLCNGYFISRVNRVGMKCADGPTALISGSICYVYDIQFGGFSEPSGSSATNRFLVRGLIALTKFKGIHKTIGYITGVTGVWEPVGDVEATGAAFFYVRKNGKTCANDPCYIYTANDVNFSAPDVNFSGFDFSQAGASDDEIDAALDAVDDGNLIAVGKITYSSKPVNGKRPRIFHVRKIYLPQ